MPKPVNYFQCEFCDKVLKTEKGIKNHEAKCKKNPKVNAVIKRKNKMKDGIEEIRQTATSPEHLIQLIEKFLMKNGIKITFYEYPSRFSLDVCNSHNSPRGYHQNWCGYGDKEGIPKGYPGWHGSWVGTIEIVDKSILNIKKNELCWSDIKDTWSDGLMNFWYLNTGSGNGGKNFHFSGMIWVYDFPKMHEEFDKNGDNFRVLDNEYADMVENYEKQFCTKRKDYIASDSMIKMFDLYNKKMTELSSKLSKAHRGRKEVLTEEFNKKFGKDLPLPSTAFSNNNEKIMKVHCNMSHKANIVHEDLEKLFDAVKAKMNEINNYIDSNPEMFI